MNAECRSINTSLHVLRQCEIPKNVKLHLELQLLKIKTLLMSGETVGTTSQPSLEMDIFERIVLQILRLKEKSSENDTLVALMGDIRSVLAVLSGLPSAGAYDRSRISATLTPQKQYSR